MTAEEIATRLAEAGITLTTAEHADLAGAYARLAPMLAMIRTPLLAPAAEPAFTFDAAP